VTIGPKDAGVALTPAGAHRILDESVVRWRGWLSGAVVDGPYAAVARRALSTLRVLGRSAAGTTSLPRRIGSERTGDSRWAQVRAVATGTRVFAAVGLAEDAEDSEAWLRVALTDADRPWPAWLAVDGQPVPQEEEQPWAGYRRSQPVRFGRNDPGVDLGLFGDVMAAVVPGGPLEAAWPALEAMADWVADNWRRPDAGRWVSGPPLRPWTGARLAARAGLDRAVHLARARNPLDLATVAWHREAAAIVRWVETECEADDGGLRLAGDLRDESADAALLSCAWSGPWPPWHPLVTATVSRVLDRLGDGPFVHRYPDTIADGYGGPDSPDLEATLMAVRALAAVGRWEEAHERMEAVVTAFGPLGLPPPAVDTASGHAMGDIPSAPTAVAVVEAALALAAGPR
jgi:GH15 family glucan-1,4-alpha-glucosidase